MSQTKPLIGAEGLVNIYMAIMREEVEPAPT